MFKCIFGNEEKAKDFAYWIEQHIETVRAQCYYDYELHVYYVEIEVKR